MPQKPSPPDTAAHCLLHTWFEKTAARFPNRVAVSFAGQSWSYAALNERTDEIARLLRARGAGPEVPVAICLERSLDLVAGLIGILKAGSAYVPVDLSYPAERLAFMLEDTGAPILLTQRALAARLPQHQAKVICLDDPPVETTTPPASEPEQTTAGERTAYILYTSGSTGRPKGCCITHRNVVRLFTATAPWFHFGEEDVWTLFHSAAFDFSVWEMWGALLHGGRLVVVPHAVSRAPEEFLTLLLRERITVLNQTPSAFRQLLAAEQSLAQPAGLALRYIIFGGEALEMRSLQPWFARHGDQRPQLVNMYGITETTVHVTYRPLKAVDATSASVIGVPIPDLRVHVLDPQMRPCPAGVAGEMFVGGAGVARGYWKRPELTAERFVSSPFEPGDILYRSGDLARLRPDGDLEYLGRMDQQVKIRGFRVELGEIESAALDHPAIRECIVLAQGAGDALELRAYLVLRGDAPRLTELRTLLARKLPDYMLPRTFVIVDRLPLTPNGKTDREALARCEGRRLEDNTETLAPRNALEAGLAEIWRSVLRREQLGVHDDFFALGGHSLLAMQVAPRASRLAGVKVPVRLLFQNPTLEAYANAIAQLQAAPSATAVGAEPTTPAPGSRGGWPLTPLQQGMLFHHLLTREAGVDIGQLVCELPERVEVVALERAWALAVNRHPALRTRFVWENLPEPRQEFPGAVSVTLEQQDWRAMPDAERAHHLSAFLASDRRRGFDLGQPPLFRLLLLRFGEEDHRFVWTFHHALLDDVGFELVLGEVFSSYEALVRGETPSLEPPRPFSDYLTSLAARADSGSAGFWQTALKGFANPTPLSVDRQPHASKDHGPTPADQELALSVEATQQLTAFASANALSLGTLVRAAWALLLSRYSGESDVVFGAIHSGRHTNVPEAATTVGNCWNTLPWRAFVDDDASVLPWLRKLEAQWQASATHAHFPLAAVQAGCEVTPGRPLFESIVDVEASHLQSSLRSQGGAWSRRSFCFFGQTNYPLTLAAYPATELHLKIEFNAARFDPATIGRLLGHLRTLLEALPANGGNKLGELPLLTEAERHTLLVGWNATQTAFPTGGCLHDLIEAQVERTPDAVALEFGEAQLSYRELNRRANLVAQRLRSLGVRADVLVGLFLERSFEMVVGMLGILKAGGAYVPIAPEYPAERVAFMLEDAAAPVVLTQSALLGQLRSLPTQPVSLALDDPTAFAHGADPGNPPALASEESLAYVIYTSGSTGQPKGVLIPHRAIVNHMRWLQSAFPLGDADCVLQKTPFSFDASVWEFFAPLLVGARLALAPLGAHRDPAQMVAALDRHQVTILQLVPSVLEVLLDHPGFSKCARLRRVFVGGEALTAELVRRFQRSLPAELHNLYGPTEVTIDSVVFSVPPGFDGALVPIGRPVANTSAYVLDGRGRPVPIGVPGELFLGGAQLARGYHARPELTAGRFVPDPFSTTTGARLYRTGDQVRYRADGNLEFLGRLDGQIKLNGFRIELGEVESALAAEPGIRRAAVAVKEGARGLQRLVAYLVLDAGRSLDTAGLETRLRQRLPAFMIPSAFVVIEELPLMPNGKLDRKALPDPQAAVPATLVNDAPATPLQAALARLLQAVLGVQRVGLADNFFALGGQSLLAMRTVAQIHSQFGCRISLAEFMSHPSVAQLATMVERAGGRVPDRLPSERIVAAYPLAPMQLGMLSASLQAPDSGVDVEQLTWRMPAELNREAFLAAWNRLAQRHDVLRTAFRWDDLEAPVQEVWAEAVPEIEDLDWRSLAAAECGQRFRDWLAADRRRSFELGRAPLWRLALIREPGASLRFVWTVHHAILDGRSMSAVLRELAACYEAMDAGREPVLREVPRYREHIGWLGGQDWRAAETYWRQQLAEVRAMAGLRENAPTLEAATSGFRDSRSQQLTVALSEAIRTQSVALEVTPSNFIQLAWALVLARGASRTEVVFGVTRAGRRSGVPGAVDMIGMFINTVPIRAPLEGAQRVEDLLRLLRRQMLEVREHEHTPLAQILEWCNRGQPLFDTFVMCERHDWSAEISRACTALVPNEVEVHEAPSFPLGLMAYDGPQQTLKICFDPQRFSAGSIEQVLHSLSELLRVLVASPKARLDELPVSELPALTIHPGPASSAGPATLPATRLRPMAHGPRLPLSLEQERIWFLHHALPNRAAYNVPLMFRLRGMLHVEALAQALAAVASRHDALRMRIAAADGEPFAEVVPLQEPLLKVTDLSHTPPGERDRLLRERFAGEFERAFDLGQAPLWRMICLRFGAADHALILIAHHLICDEWSLRLWLAELEAAYTAQVAGRQVDLAASPIQYADYAAWQRGRMARPAQAEHFAYWQRQLAGAPGRIALPCDHPHPLQPTLAGGVVRRALSAQTMTVLEQLGRAEGATLFMLMAAAWQSYLARITGGADIVVACPVAQRDQPELSQVIGFFLNTVPIRARVDGQRSFRQLLQDVRRTVLEALDHGSVPFDEIVRSCAGAGTRGPAPLMQVMLAVNSDLPRSLELPGVRGDVVDAEWTLAKTELTLLVGKAAGGAWQVAVEFSRELFERATIERMQEGFACWLGELARRADSPLDSLEVLTDQEKALLLGQFSQGEHASEAALRKLTAGSSDQWQPTGARAALRCHVLDARLRLQPVGVPGELFLGGLPQATAERIQQKSAVLAPVASPFPGQPDARLWRTGQHCRWLADGSLEFLDNQARLSEERPAVTMHAQPAVSTACQLPRNATETALVSVWQDVLRRTPIGIHDDFFALGGHSLLAMRVAARVSRALGVEVPVRQIFDAPTIAQLADAMARDRGELELAPIPRVSRETPLPLSHEQERLWFLHQVLADPAAYNVSFATLLRGRLDFERLESAWQRLTQRQEILRMGFVTKEGVVGQVPATTLAPVVRVEDLGALPAGARDQALQAALQAEITRPFDLTAAPLFRVACFRTSDSEQVLVVTLHHLICDEWSTRLLWAELEHLYATGDGAVELPALPIQYADYAAWQRAQAATPSHTRQRDHWRAELAGAPSALNLPADRPRTTPASCRGGQVHFEVEPTLAATIHRLAREEGATPSMVWLALFSILLHRLSGQDDLLVGTPLAQRRRPEVQSLVGFFLNTLPIRSRLEAGGSFRTHLRRARGVLLGAFEHGELPFDEIVRQHPEARGTQHPALLQAFFVMLSEPPVTLRLAGLVAEPVALDPGTAKFDLTLFLNDSGSGGLAGMLEFSADLFDRSSIERIAAQFRQLAASAAAQPDEPVSLLALLPADQRRHVVAEFNRTTVAFDLPEGVQELFEAQARRTPTAVAVMLDRQTWTYAELNLRATGIAHELKRLGVGPDVLVGICLERSPQMVAAVLATMKAGGACLPLDPGYPVERLRFMLEDVQPAVVLTQTSLAGQLPASQTPRLLLDSWPPSSASPEELPPPSNRERLAYVLFTSGSTGRPKGVGMPQRALLNLIAWQNPQSSCGEGDRTLQFASLSFDVSFQELFATLTSGGTLVLVPDAVRRDLRALARVVCDQHVARLFLPFVVLDDLAGLLSEAGERELALKEIITAGEQLRITPALVKLFERLPGAVLVNQYGPTETHVVTAHTLGGAPAHWPALPPIGRPIANTQVYVLDEHGQPLPLGVPGEFCIGGLQVARGYLNRPELTAEKFVRDPFSGNAAARLYRTGDRCRWLPDGTIEFLGRRDEQVKVRGFRVELGEIEAALNRHPAVRQAAVIACEAGAGNRELVAFVASHDGAAPALDLASLREQLRSALPEHMLPARFVCLAALPFSPNGKVDRRALAARASERPALPAAAAAPDNEIEAGLVAVWGRVLGRQGIGVEDDFFELGGHSLLALRLMREVERTFGQSLPLASLFSAPTIRRFARLLDERLTASSITPVGRLRGRGEGAPLFYVPGIYGYEFLPEAIARRVHEVRPFYDGLQYPGLDGRQTPLNRVEAIAAHLLAQVEKVLPAGPLCLGGYSFGGVVAYELARQLQARGRPVEAVLLIDSFAPVAFRKRSSLETVRALRRHLAGMSTRDRVRFLARHASRKAGAVRRGLAQRFAAHHRNAARDPGAGATPEQASHQVRLTQAALTAYEHYRPAPYEGRAVLLQVAEREFQIGLRYALDPFNGWQGLVRGGLEVVLVPGDHNTVLKEPAVSVLAGKVVECLTLQTQESTRHN
jgi:amino acid adenylation domain-containing protein